MEKPHENFLRRYRCRFLLRTCGEETSMTKDIITSVIILLFLITFALWSIARNIKESIVDVTFAIEKMSAEIRRARESIDGLREETAKLRIQAMKDKPDNRKVEEIVRCEDCKHYIRHDKRCGYWNHGVKPTMWCSQAERREDATD